MGDEDFVRGVEWLPAMMTVLILAALSRFSCDRQKLMARFEG